MQSAGESVAAGPCFEHSHSWAGKLAATGAAGGSWAAPHRIPQPPGSGPVTKKSQGSQGGMHQCYTASVWVLFPRASLSSGYCTPPSPPRSLSSLYPILPLPCILFSPLNHTRSLAWLHNPSTHFFLHPRWQVQGSSPVSPGTLGSFPLAGPRCGIPWC